MAAVKEQTDAQVAAEAIAKTRKFYQEYVNKKAVLERFLADMKGMEGVIIQLLNSESAIDARIKAKEIDLARIEKECATRISNMERGLRALTERLTKKESEAEDAMAQAKKIEANANRARLEAEAVKAAYERKLDEMTRRSTGTK